MFPFGSNKSSSQEKEISVFADLCGGLYLEAKCYTQ